MKNPLLKKLMPHAIAIAIFLIVAALFCKPALEGNVLQQHDTVGWKGMAQNSFDYRDKNGHFPLWNPNLFSGMPNYQVAMEGKSILPDSVKIFSLGLPKPINFFFLGSLCFYILCLALGLNPVVGILGGLAYAFSTYNAVIITAGHDTQMLATAFMPLLLAGILCTYQKKYWLGFALTTFGAYQEISVNHLQISYYFFLIAIIITIGYLVKWIQEKDFKHILVAGGITFTAALIGLAGSAMVLLTTSEYSKFTMRGGKDISIEGDKVVAAKTKGLDTSYAFQYSLGKTEILTLFMPNAFGGGHSQSLGEGSKVANKLINRGVDPNNAEQLAQSLPKYWGALPYTAGPAYIGAILFVLGLLGFVLVKSPLRWGLLAATFLGIFIAWGKNFAGFNMLMFEHFPLFNKFRAPSMAQVIPQLTLAISAVLALNQLLFSSHAKEQLQKDFKKIIYATGALFAVLGILYFSMDYSSAIDSQIIAGYKDANGSDEMGRLIVSGLKEERSGLFGGQLLRSLGLTLVLLGVLYLYMKNMIKPVIAGAALIAVSTLELTITSKTYLTDETYVSADEYENNNFAANTIDQAILNDKDPNFRVYNMAGDTYNESRTSYYHKSIGGYHPAKLRIYQDVIEKYLSYSPNPAILNMLNAKYIIVKNQQTGQASLIPNASEAYGNCWFVQHVKIVPDRVTAINEIGTTNLRDTAIVDAAFTNVITQPQADSAATIKMTNFDNDAIEYESNSTTNQFAVFSEIYYPKGWNAYIDDKKTDYANADYILRGLSVPAGKHTIRFVFEPESVSKGRTIMYIASILVALIFVGGLFMAWKQNNRSAEKTA